MKTHPILSISLLCLLCAAATASANITIETVTVGNPGNPGDTSNVNSAVGHVGQFDLGAVGYTYNIGKYVVTVSQYTEFLNKVAATDTYGLYNPNMAADLSVAGTTRSGNSGSFTYSVIAGMGSHPVTLVNWYDAARFCNWLSNGQPTGAETTGVTETGSYTLTGNTGLPSYNGTGLYRLPTESEWYKAAYYDPSIGGTNKYWTYATRSNSQPGNVVGSSANQANYYNSVYSVTQSFQYKSTQNYLTDVGVFTGSASAYGTYDQNGDVYQWNDAIFSSTSFPNFRGTRGGNWGAGATYMQSATPDPQNPASDGYDGFRIVTVPEPASAALLLGGGALLALLRRRSGAAV